MRGGGEPQDWQAQLRGRFACLSRETRESSFCCLRAVENQVVPVPTTWDPKILFSLGGSQKALKCTLGKRNRDTNGKTWRKKDYKAKMPENKSRNGGGGTEKGKNKEIQRKSKKGG